MPETPELDEPEQSSLTLSSLPLRQRGDYADLTVIRENLFELPEDCIAAATVLMTITNGQIAFEGNQAYPPGHATCPSGAAPAP